MRSDYLKRHIKVHTTEDQTENIGEICRNIVMEILDKMFVEEATESKQVDDHDCTTTKRKHDGDDNQSAPKTKLEEIVTDKSVNGNFIIHNEECTCCRGITNNVSEYTSTVNGGGFRGQSLL